MRLRNVTLATAILLALTGCGSSGGGSNTPNNNQPTARNEQTQRQVTDARIAEEAKKAEEARLAKEARKAEEARISARISQLTLLAQEKGLTDTEVDSFAKNNVNNDDETAKKI